MDDEKIYTMAEAAAFTEAAVKEALLAMRKAVDDAPISLEHPKECVLAAMDAFAADLLSKI